ncbi:hypothetical protein AVEN_142234-1 [Araneus ventricosus]|uniref:Uncharacterized protein n=1 Tax=Araneus ventricosus TaxID=182803 RepID=A0A4Y2DWB8_ARAVE|nr:hypothetical protein AVEN_142234-1 [Araneus ventricosus]
MALISLMDLHPRSVLSFHDYFLGFQRLRCSALDSSNHVKAIGPIYSAIVFSCIVKNKLGEQIMCYINNNWFFQAGKLEIMYFDRGTTKSSAQTISKTFIRPF